MSSANDEYKEELLVFGGLLSTPFVLNTRLLKALTTAAGFSFEDLRKVPVPVLRERSSVAKNEVSLLSKEQLIKLEIECGEFVDAMSLGYLYRWQGTKQNILCLSPVTTKQIVNNWLTLSDTSECIVCFEEAHISELAAAVNVYLQCECGAGQCFGCLLDLTICSEDGDIHCPNCRAPFNFMSNTMLVIYRTLSSSPSLEGMSDMQLAFIKQVTDGFRGEEDADDLQKYKDVLKDIDNLRMKHMRRLGLTDPSQIDAAINERMHYLTFRRLEIPMPRSILKARKMKAATSAAQSTGHRLSENGCANCHKSFWDKTARRRAPKCQACRKVLYCSGACKKAHKRKHAAKCSAVSRKKKKSGNVCRPFA